MLVEQTDLGQPHLVVGTLRYCQNGEYMVKLININLLLCDV